MEFFQLKSYKYPVTLDLSVIRGQFPILSEIIYLDNAATAQNPRVVIDSISEFYSTSNANVHRGLHPLAEKATDLYEDARDTVRKFINAKNPEEIIFTKGTTESINLVAQSWGKANLSEDDKVVPTILEHHSNITPWMQIADETGCEISWIDIDDNGYLRIDQLDDVLAQGNVKLISITGLSNVIGVHTPLNEVISKAHEAGAKVLVDAAQLAAHHQIDVTELDCDFLVFSGHKIYGPMGIGVLYGKKELLESMLPYQTGGGMIREVTSDHFTCAELPEKFEAGTPPVAEAVGLKTAIEWLSQFDWKDIEEHENKLIQLAFSELSSIKNLTILGSKPTVPTSPTLPTIPNRSGCISFIFDNIHPHDLTDLLGEKGICLRAGHHCAQPLHRRFGVEASTRLSVGIYNTEEEIMRVKPKIEEVIDLFK